MILFFLTVNAAEYRRHIIILQDNSGSYYHTLNKENIKSIQNKVENLFSDNTLINTNYCNLSEEIKNDISFFDPNKDEISFYYFVASSRDNVKFKTETEGDFVFFENYFFQPAKHHHFSAYNGNVYRFLKDNFEDRPNLNTFHRDSYNGIGTYSFSAFAYPLILDIIKSDYTKEYVFLIISDFKTGSTFGNKQDEEIFKTVFRQKADQVLNRVNWLEGQFFKIAFFDYYETGMYNTILGVTAFKIRPNSGLYSPENTEIRLNSNIILTQKEYLKNEYILGKTYIVFAHNEKLLIDKVYIEISGSSGTCRKEIDGVMLDSSSMTYCLPEVVFTLPGYQSVNQSYSGNIKFVFETSYDIGNGRIVKYIYDVNRDINHSNFIFLTQLSLIQKIMCILFFVILAFVILFFILRHSGKPLGIMLKINKFTDSYEEVDFSENGRGKLITDYKNWESQDEENRMFRIKVRGKLSYRHINRFYNWKENTGFPVVITPLSFTLPEGFGAHVECGTRVSNSSNHPITYEQAFVDGEFEFYIVFEKDNCLKIEKPQYFSFEVEVELYSNGFNKFRYTQIIKYEFHVGPELGFVWVGMDPGTTGSCIATATNSEDLVIEQTSEGQDKISPSVIMIDTGKIKENTEAQIREACIFGSRAAAYKENETRRKFLSIKKLLGYKEVFELKEGISVDSTMLSSLLIEGLYKEHEQYIVGQLQYSHPQFFEWDGSYKPRRLAVAIPNNFTATKIQHLKNCIEKVSDSGFKEIRFIYEAEAILIYYINKQDANVKLQESPEGENVFIYDMGGATINVTLANIKRRKEKGDWVYMIDVISKLGYGIGGDTIDYAFIKWIYSKQEYYPILQTTNPFEKGDILDKHKLKDAVLQLKIDTIANFENKNNNLLIRERITNFNGLNLTPVSDENDNVSDEDPFKTQCLNNDKSFLYDQNFETYIWENIKSIVSDMITICKEKNVSSLDTVIMSGRSSSFPKVKETVENTVRKLSSFKPAIIALSLTESKSAVARGACYYGIQKKSIRLKTMTSNGVFGVIQKTDMIQPAGFHRLIDAGEVFKRGTISGTAVIHEMKDFGLDGNKVRFCQVMGINPEKIIANNENHKFEDIAVLPARPFEITQVSMDITEKDKIYCTVWDSNGDAKTKESKVSDADITKCNDEHYTFFVK